MRAFFCGCLLVFLLRAGRAGRKIFRMKIFIRALFLFAFAVCAAFAENLPQINPCPSGLEWRFGKGQIFENLKTSVGEAYKTADGQTLRFDISYPKAEAPKGGYPLILYIHGGAWVGGERFSGYGYFNDEIRHYNQKGIAVASLAYRFARAENPKRTMDCCVVDCMDALRYIVKNSKRLCINPDKIGVYGHSAGGHLAFMVAMADQNLFEGDEALKGVKYKIACAVPQSGPTFFWGGENAKNKLYHVLFGNPCDKQLMEKLSPLKYVKKDLPPMLILHGQKDELVPVKAAEIMREKLEEAGAPVEAVFAKNARHSFENALEPDNDGLADIRRAFFAEYLCGSQPSKK